MKKKAVIAMAVVIVVLTAGVIISRGKIPYKDLKASDIVSVAVYLSPPDETVQITNAEELVSYLRKVTIYNEDTSYTDYCGQTVMFTLTMADGSQEKITACNPFVIINQRNLIQAISLLSFYYTFIKNQSYFLSLS